MVRNSWVKQPFTIKGFQCFSFDLVYIPLELMRWMWAFIRKLAYEEKQTATASET